MHISIHLEPIKRSVYRRQPRSVRVTALRTESLYFVSHIILKAFNYTHFHNTNDYEYVSHFVVQLKGYFRLIKIKKTKQRKTV